MSEDKLDIISDPPMYFDRQGVPMTLRQWSSTFENNGAIRRIASEYVGDYRVSTVWLGLDQSFEDGPHAPIIFETLIFYGGVLAEESYDEVYIDRYCTEEEALAGHLKAVEHAKTLV